MLEALLIIIAAALVLNTALNVYYMIKVWRGDDQ